jgi:hypothetical protein
VIVIEDVEIDGVSADNDGGVIYVGEVCIYCLIYYICMHIYVYILVMFV